MSEWNEHGNEWKQEGGDGHGDPTGDPTGDRLGGAASGDEELPYGMSGVSGILERLSTGIETGEWSPRKCRMVAEYVLSLADDYWLSSVEASYCRRVLA